MRSMTLSLVGMPQGRELPTNTIGNMRKLLATELATLRDLGPHIEIITPYAYVWTARAGLGNEFVGFLMERPAGASMSAVIL